MMRLHLHMQDCKCATTTKMHGGTRGWQAVQVVGHRRKGGSASRRHQSFVVEVLAMLRCPAATQTRNGKEGDPATHTIWIVTRDFGADDRYYDKYYSSCQHILAAYFGVHGFSAIPFVA